METYKNRNGTKYKKLIIDKLTFNNLVESALVIEGNTDFDKLVRIDLFGLSGSSLLKFEDDKEIQISNQFEQLLKKLEAFESKRILVKIRFLFTYIYSDFAFSLIEAENSHNRATILNKMHIINFDPEIHLSEMQLFSSNIYRNQNLALKHIQRLIKKYLSYDDCSHQLKIRFSPIPINYCGLLINNFTSFDCYSLSKLSVNSDQLMFQSPIITLNKKNEKRKFQDIEDHFRYLWNHELTLFSKDATLYDINKPDSLSQIVKPSKINFQHKSDKIFKISLYHEDDRELLEKKETLGFLK